MQLFVYLKKKKKMGGLAKDFDTVRLHGSLCMVAMWLVSWDFGLTYL